MNFILIEEFFEKQILSLSINNNIALLVVFKKSPVFILLFLVDKYLFP